MAHWAESADGIDHLTDHEFSIDNHQRIFAAIRTIAADGRVPDRVTTVQYLADRYGDAGHWLGLVLGLEDGMPVVLNLESYIEILREKAALRRILYVAQEATAKALSGTERAADINRHIEKPFPKSSFVSARAFFWSSVRAKGNSFKSPSSFPVPFKTGAFSFWCFCLMRPSPSSRMKNSSKTIRLMASFVFSRFGSSSGK
ncbi:hypothetical protein EBT16_09735 [bacterium]|nr:hypothetical protein [bacterium]